MDGINDSMMGYITTGLSTAIQSGYIGNRSSHFLIDLLNVACSGTFHQDQKSPVYSLWEILFSRKSCLKTSWIIHLRRQIQSRVFTDEYLVVRKKSGGFYSLFFLNSLVAYWEDNNETQHWLLEIITSFTQKALWFNPPI